MSRALRLELLVVPDQAREAARQAIADLKKVEEQANRVGKAMGRAFSGRPGAGGASAEKAAADAELRRYQDHWKRKQAEEAKAQAALARSAEQARKREAAEQMRAAAQAAREADNEQRRYAAYWKKREAEQARGQAAAARAAEQSRRRELAEADRHARRAVALEQRKHREQLREAQRSSEAMRRMFIGIGTAFAGMAGLQGVTGVISSIVGAFDEANRSAADAARMVRGYREALLELAALKGNVGNTSKTLAEDLQFRSQTLQTAEQSRAFQLAALGSGQAGVMAGNISQGEFDKFMASGGRFQAAEGGDPGVHGELIGMIPQLMGGKNITAEQAFAREQQLYNIFQPGNTSFSALSAGLTKASPLIQSGLLEDRQAAAMLSMFSTVDKGGFSDLLNQFVRATSGSLGKLKGSPMMEGFTDAEIQKRGEYVQSIGATVGMSPLEIGDVIAADFRKQREAAAKAGTKFDPLVYLQAKGFGADEERRVLMTYESKQTAGQIKPFLDLAAGAGPGRDAAAGMLARADADPVMQARRAELTSELGSIARGAGANEHYAILRRQAFEQLRQEGQVWGDFEDLDSGGMFGGILKGHRRAAVSHRMSQIANLARLEAGMPTWLGGDMRDDRIWPHQIKFDAEQRREMLADPARRAQLMERIPALAPGTSDDAFARRLYGSSLEVARQGGEAMPGSREAAEINLKAAELNLRAAEMNQDAIAKRSLSNPPPRKDPVPVPARRPPVQPRR